jgi:hypothetical protein
MKDWLARLSFSFLIIAAVLVWTGYQGLNATGGQAAPWKITLCFVGAGACIALFIAGVRQRHR